MYGTVKHVNVEPEWLVRTLEHLLLDLASELDPKVLREISRLLRAKSEDLFDPLDVEEDAEATALTMGLFNQISLWAGSRADYLDHVRAGSVRHVDLEQPLGARRFAGCVRLRWIHLGEAPQGALGLTTQESLVDFVERRPRRKLLTGPEVYLGQYDLVELGERLFREPWSPILYVLDVDGALTVVGVGEVLED